MKKRVTPVSLGSRAEWDIGRTLALEGRQRAWRWGQVLVKREKNEKKTGIAKMVPIEVLHGLPTHPPSLSSSVSLQGRRRWEIRGANQCIGRGYRLYEIGLCKIKQVGKQISNGVKNKRCNF